MDKKRDHMVSKMSKKSKKGKSEASKSEEPKDAMGWLKKAYTDADPKDGAPKVGDIGYV